MMWLSPCALVAVLCGVCAAEFLLPGDVVPSHYDVGLTFDIDAEDKFPYFGVVKIDVTAVKPTSKIILHAQGYTVDNERVSLEGPEGSLQVDFVSLNDTVNFLKICLKDSLVQNANYTLTIPFSGNLKIDLDGAYISSYVDKKTNVKEYLIATQFEAISARKGFPCFDEPMYKATFKVTIGHHADYTAVSNMPVASTSQQNAMEDNWSWKVMNEKFKSDISSFKWDLFENSVPMSTYLVAYVVSKFTYLESPKGLSDTLFRIWARQDAADQTEYASTIGPKILSYYEKWFNVTFPLPKQDMIAIPDFAAGAMENWGLITYRETALLYDREESSLTHKERVAEVVAHELAHQWFGNLVTMKWWSDLWLNEGFATFMASLGVHSVEPDWQIRDVNAASEMTRVWSKDSLASSHPVSVPLDDPKRISEIFDDISYSKGSVLIMMMTNFLGEDVFRKAINEYLIRHSYGNAEQDDLWRCLTAAAAGRGALPGDVTVKQVMDTWTTQTGYPLLTVNRDYSDKSLTVTQKRYLALGTLSESKTSWWVPLNMVCERDSRNYTPALQWLSDKDGVDDAMRFEHASAENEWVLMNANMYALVRVNYDAKNWELLTSALNSEQFESIPVLSRVQLLSDSFELAWSSLLDYDVALRIANYLSQETEYLPLEAGLTALSRIEGILARDAEYGAVLKYVRKVVTPAYMRHGGLAARSGGTGNDLLTAKLQAMSTRWACRAKVPGCEEGAIELYQRWMESDTPDEDNPIPLDLRGTVYCTAVSRGSVSEWRFLVARQRSARGAAARVTMLAALACTREPWLLQQFLEWTVTEDSEVRRQDAVSVLVGVARSPVGYHIAKDFVFYRFDELYKADYVHNATLVPYEDNIVMKPDVVCHMVSELYNGDGLTPCHVGLNTLGELFGEQGRKLGHVIRSIVDQFTTQRELDEFIQWREKHSKELDGAKLSIDQAIEAASVNIAWLAKNKRRVVDKMREFAAYDIKNFN